MKWYGYVKYGNRKTEIDGITFHSKKEASRYMDLKFYEDHGFIQDLQLQVKFDLLPAQSGEIRNERPVSYVADFVYVMDGKVIVEDVKGMRTDVYKLKRKLMKYIHDIEVTEI